MSSNKINSTTNRVMLQSINASLQNFQLINGLTTIVDNNAKIKDLLLTDASGDTQLLLESCKNIFDYAIARGLATITVVGTTDTSGNVTAPSVNFNYNQYYSTTQTSTSTITLYEIDLTYFYKYDATPGVANSYIKKTNDDLYNGGVVTNATYIGKVNNLILSMNQCTNLISDIMSTL
jgi:hypothetical protein